MTCKMCKYWRHIRDVDFNVDDDIVWYGPHGECRKIDIDSASKKFAWICSSDSDNMSDLSLITSPDFGCNLFEKL